MQVSVPQQSLDPAQRAPAPAQERPLEQVPLLHVSELQHWDDVEQAPPDATQPEAPTQTPPEQAIVPQQSELWEQGVPAPWQTPAVQTLFVLHSRVPQQSPLVPQA